jgi:predicted Zn-dependent protease
MQRALREGITMGSLESEVLNLSEEALVRKSDSIIKELMADGVPVGILNSAVYTALGRHELQKALALARLQALANPSNANAWDTFGEVYYFLGETELAAKYERQRTRIDSNFTGGGMEVWKKDLEEYRKRWEANAPSATRPAK